MSKKTRPISRSKKKKSRVAKQTPGTSTRNRKKSGLTGNPSNSKGNKKTPGSAFSWATPYKHDTYKGSQAERLRGLLTSPAEERGEIPSKLRKISTKTLVISDLGKSSLFGGSTLWYHKTRTGVWGVGGSLPKAKYWQYRETAYVKT